MDATGEVVKQAPMTMGNGSVSGSVKLPEALLEEVEKNPVDLTRFTSSKGIVFSVEKVQSWIVAEAVRKLKPPKIPVYYSDDLGREEENPAHPEYVAAMDDYNLERGKISVVATLGFGTKVVSCPAGVASYESEEWADDLRESLDIDIPARGKARYAAWLRLYALTDEDSHALMTQLNALSGAVSQEETEEAVDNFRSESERSADTSAPVNANV